MNEAGIAACLLNRYGPNAKAPIALNASRPSRGSIIPALMAQTGSDSALAWLQNDFDPGEFAAFTLLLISPAASGSGSGTGNGRGKPGSLRTSGFTSPRQAGTPSMCSSGAKNNSGAG